MTNENENEVECYVCDSETGEWHFTVIPESEFDKLHDEMAAMCESQYFSMLSRHPDVVTVDIETARWRGFEEPAMSFEEALASDDDDDDDGEEEEE